MRLIRYSSDLSRALILGALLLAGHAAAAAPTLELRAAWGGMTRPARLTELRVRLTSPLAGTARLRIRAGATVIDSSLAVSSDAPSVLEIPVPAADELSVEASLPDTTRLTRTLALHLTEEPLAALAGDIDAGDLAASIARVEVGPEDYPAHAAAYEAIDALALDGARLTVLGPAQLRALIGYLARCGPTVAFNVPPDAARVLTAAAGCGGRALLLLDDPRSVPATLAAALANAPVRLLTSESLRALMVPTRGPWIFVVAGALIYLAGAAVLAALVRHAAILALYATLGTLGALYVGHLSAANPRLVLWAESDSADAQVHYAAVSESDGAGRVTRSQLLPAQLAGAQPCLDTLEDSAAEGPGTSLWHWDSAQDRYSGVTFQQILFQPSTICWQGNFPLSRTAALQQGAAHALRVSNEGAAAWPAGMAVLGDLHYAVPELAPGHTQSVAALTTDAVTPEVELAASRALGAGVVLWPLELPTLQIPRAAIRSYLLLRVPPAVGPG